MTLTIIDCNFFNDKDWIYKLRDANNVSFYILGSNSYKALKLRSPINKQHLDAYNIGTVIEAGIERSGDRNIVVSIL